MNLLDKYSTQGITTSCASTSSFKKDNKQIYKDPLKKWPLKGLAYSNELGAVVSGISPKAGNLLWAPALMYFGADIYDKYKNDENSYNPSAKRGFEQAIFQTLASVIMPTAAVHLGQKAISGANRLTKTGLTTQTKQDVLEKSLAFMSEKSLHSFVDNVDEYAKQFKNSILTVAQDSKGELKSKKPIQQAIKIINPFKSKNPLAFANEEKLGHFADKQARKIFEMRESLMKNECPKGLSKSLFTKFQKIQGEYKKIYPSDKYMGKAAKNILKQWHEKQILNQNLIKTVGGFIALALFIKPIDDFVENIVIKKTVEPSLDFFQKEVQNRKVKTSINN